jgi:hypothetical protein
MILFIIIPALVFGIVNAEFFDTIDKETRAGAKWHHVGETPIDPKAKSIALGGKIYWKLKKGESNE